MTAMPGIRHRFGPAEVWPVERVLLIDGEPAGIGGRAFDVLIALIEHRDRMLTKTELLDIVWPHLVVEENNLQVQVSTLRKLLGPAAIVTIPGRGYRFAAALEDAPPAAPPAEPAAAAAPTTGPVGNLPAAALRLVGRDADLAGVCALVGEHRLVTLAGAGGIGKTCLAQAAAQRVASAFADGAWMVELAPVSDPARLAAAVAQALRVSLPGEAVAEELAERLRGQSLLVVLDNCEHLVDAAAALVQRLLDAAPGLHVLVTSQQRLKLAGEQVVRLGTLSVPDGPTAADEALGHGAVALFVERAAALQTGFVLDVHNAAAVIDICRHLDGVALALELAAARVPLLGVEGVRTHLAERFRLLTGGPRRALERHRTMRATLEWSHALLSADEQTVYRRLGVFVGSFGLDLAQRVASDDMIDAWAVLDHLGALIDKSMVVVEAGEVPRYRLLETARDDARERLLAAGELAALRRRHAESVHEVLDGPVRAALGGIGPIDDLVRGWAPEIDNLRVAIEWAGGPDGDAALAIDLANDAAVLMYHAGRYPECARWMLAVEPRLEAARSPIAAARFRWGLALVGLHGSVTASRRLALAEQARQVFEAHDERLMLNYATATLVYLAIVLNDFATAERYLAALHALVGPDTPTYLRSSLCYIEGMTHRYRGRADDAERAFAETARLARAAGSTRYVFFALNNLAAVYLESGRVEAAVTEHRALLDVLGRSPLADSQMLAFALMWLAHGLVVQGALAEAQACVQQGVPHARRSVGVRHFSGLLALLAARQGRLDDAARLVGADDAARQRRGETRTAADERTLAATLQCIAAAHSPAQVDVWRAEGAALDEDGVAGLALAGVTPPVG